jgi:myo-inositol-1(or 4)-monophosphatase
MWPFVIAGATPGGGGSLLRWPPVADLADLLDLAVTVAHEAGAMIVAAGRSDPEGVSTKSSATDMVTATDRAVEALLAERLLASRPDDGILGEEGASVASGSGVTWVVDPIDGTTNFAYGYPAFCTSIAAELDGAPVVGVIFDPVRGQTFSARRGGGAFLDGRPIAVRAAGPPLAEALVGTGFGYDAERRAAQGAVLARVLPHVRDVRRAGSAALDLCTVGCGRLDAYYERGLQHWDHAAGALIAAEAGAWVGTLEGGPLDRERTIVAARPDLVEPLLALLRSAGADALP